MIWLSKGEIEKVSRLADELSGYVYEPQYLGQYRDFESMAYDKISEFLREFKEELAYDQTTNNATKV